jgi:hypothetical protein
LGVPEAPSPDGRPRLVAFAFTRPLVDIVPAPRRRDWMETAHERWPNRCLPLLVANEAGWALLNPHPFRATWDGRESPKGVTIEFEGDDPNPVPVRSHFGFGVVTWNVPYVFRTPPGCNLLARGPANYPKDGICALEGLVETDWAFANFTMNWKLTRPGHAVEFEAGEPFCMVVPQQRGTLESFEPEICDIADDPELKAEFEHFARQREVMQVKKFASSYVPELESFKKDWERHYYKGLSPSGNPAPEHQVTLKLPRFSRPGD